MKITGINIPENFYKGLKAINESRFGDVVAIAGKNGAGKTRLLDVVVAGVREHIMTPLNYDNISKKYKFFEKRLNERSPADAGFAKDKERLEWHAQKIKNDSYFTVDSQKESYSAVKFVPSNLKLESSYTAPLKVNMDRHAAAKKLAAVERIHENTYSYIQRENDRNREAVAPDNSNHPEASAVRASYNRLDELICSFLGVRMGRNLDGRCTLFNLPLEDAGLSDGQKVLLQLCVLLHAQNETLDNLILILDEPENHLHPEAQVEFIKKVQEVLKDGQIWIATHSIHILSHLDTSDIWYMHDGGLEYAGKKPEKVLRGLLGDEEQVERLQDFIGLPSVLAANQFAYECLFAPSATAAGSDDPQTSQISAIIDELRKGKDKISVLDFGAGKGRLISSILDSSDDKKTVKEWLDYIAYDAFPDDKEKCKQAIERVYDNSDNRYFNELRKLRECKNDNSIDIVVMCNVLHEISPNGWVSLFNENSEIFKLLSENGYLLIVEDTVIPKGERPNEDGFFILQRLELSKLFGISVEDSNFVTQSHENKERLHAHLIPQKYLANITNDSKKEAITELKKRCKDEVKKIRGDETFRNGKQLGFWSQQLANTTLYLT